MDDYSGKLTHWKHGHHLQTVLHPEISKHGRNPPLHSKAGHGEPNAVHYRTISGVGLSLLVANL